MASEGPNSPGTMADDDAIGTVAWNNPDNAKASDSNCALAVGTLHYEYSIRLVVGGSIVGDEKSNDAKLPVGSGNKAYISYGGSSDKWGLTPTPTEINGSDFGVVFATSNQEQSTISHYLEATNFGFSIPSDATIDGILVEVEQYYETTFGSDRVDHIRITVYYTPEGWVVIDVPSVAVETAVNVPTLVRDRIFDIPLVDASVALSAPTLVRDCIFAIPLSAIDTALYIPDVGVAVVLDVPLAEIDVVVNVPTLIRDSIFAIPLSEISSAVYAPGVALGATIAVPLIEIDAVPYVPVLDISGRQLGVHVITSHYRQVKAFTAHYRRVKAITGE
jgi:hypothetical protein